MLTYEVSYMTHTPAYLSWRHQATTCILKQEGNPGSLKLQVFWDCLKSLISAIAQENLFIKDFSHVFLALWTPGSLPDNLSPPAQCCCSGAADLDSAIDPNTQTRSCKKYVLPFFFFSFFWQKWWLGISLQTSEQLLPPCPCCLTTYLSCEHAEAGAPPMQASDAASDTRTDSMPLATNAILMCSSLATTQS